MSEAAATARQDKAVLLSLLGASTMVIAYALALGVLSDADMASKFENGVAPDHTDIAGIRVSVIGSIVTRHARRTARHLHATARHSWTVLPAPLLTRGRERPRPPGLRAGARQRSAGCRPRHRTSTRPQAAGLLYVPKMSATHSPTVSAPASCGRSMHWGCDSRAPRWSLQLRHCSSPLHRGRVVLGVAVSDPNPDGFASLSVLLSSDSGGPIPYGPRRPPNERSVITNVTLTMRSITLETSSNAMQDTVIRPSGL